MNETTFSRANGLYKAGDYRGALRKYTDCLRDEQNPLQPGEYGALYHHIGNCLMKMKNSSEAIRAYLQAEEDSAYTAGASLHTNLGKAYSSLKEYDKAIDELQSAINDETYTSRYKALMSLGNIQMKMGDSADAGRNFREAALDPNNPDPAKSLLNLGVCFMSLGRPGDAIASYESAKQFNMSNDTRNRLLASMGQAHAANNEPEAAVECFKEVTADGTYQLSDSASVDYSRCISELNKLAAAEATAVDMSGLDVSTADDLTNSSDPYFYDDGTEVLDKVPGYIDAYEGDDDKFFTATEDELKEIYKQQAKKERKRKGVGLKILLVFIILIVLIVGAGAAGYILGYGYPTQQMTTTELFSNPSTTNSAFSSTVSESSRSQIVNSIVKDDNVEIEGVTRGMNESKVYAKAKTEQGGEITYVITMKRDLVGWKVSNAELYFASQNS